MIFRKLTLDKMDELRPYFATNQRRICDSTIGGTFMWRDHMNTEYAIDEDTLFLRARLKTGEKVYTPPRNKERPAEEFFDHLFEYCQKNNQPMRFFPVSGKNHKLINERFPIRRECSDPAWSDYMYNAQDLATLKGRRYSGQRNHMNKFKRLFPDWRFEAIDDSNMEDVKKFLADYMENHKKDAAEYAEGNIKAMEVLENNHLYQQIGGVLYTEGHTIAGFACGEVVGDTLFVHTEKALIKYHGSYQMIVNQFAKMYTTDDVHFINREEDDGDEGLRTSKLSYHPCELLHKYYVEIV